MCSCLIPLKNSLRPICSSGVSNKAMLIKFSPLFKKAVLVTISLSHADVHKLTINQIILDQLICNESGDFEAPEVLGPQTVALSTGWELVCSSSFHLCLRWKPNTSQVNNSIRVWCCSAYLTVLIQIWIIWEISIRLDGIFRIWAGCIFLRLTIVPVSAPAETVLHLQRSKQEMFAVCFISETLMLPGENKMQAMSVCVWVCSVHRSNTILHNVFLANNSIWNVIHRIAHVAPCIKWEWLKGGVLHLCPL